MRNGFIFKFTLSIMASFAPLITHASTEANIDQMTSYAVFLVELSAAELILKTKLRG